MALSDLKTETELSSPPPKEPQTLLVRTLKSPLFFATLTLALTTLCGYGALCWPRRWLIAGAPVFHFLLLLGEDNGLRVLPTINLWPIITTLHLAYAVCSTSWLLYWFFVPACYGGCFLMSLFQFNAVGSLLRRAVRKAVALKMIHFIDDKIALFDLPALEIDTDVDGLMVLRGVTSSLSSLSFVVHGVEVGIKLSDDMELAIQTEEVKVKLFRSIDIGDTYANLKGGEFEMTFASLEDDDKKGNDSDADSIFAENTALLKAANRNSISIDRSSMHSRNSISIDRSSMHSRNSMSMERTKMMEVMTDGETPESTNAKEGLSNVTAISPATDESNQRYRENLEFLEETNSIATARSHIRAATLDAKSEDLNTLRAAICSALHSQPSVPHPPAQSIKVTTIKNSSSPRQKAFMHRLPMLLRLLLNPLSYFHPVSIASITATASGRWVDFTLNSKLFKTHGESNSEIAALQKRISHWLCDANFALELTGIKGMASVPFITDYDIVCEISIDDVMAYRAHTPQEKREPDPEIQPLSRASTISSLFEGKHSSLEKGHKEAGSDQHGHLKQIIRLGGADARFTIPSYLLPHHEHILPPPPPPASNPESEARLEELQTNVEEADGKPKTLQAETELEKLEKDEAAVKMSVHVRLPAVFDQTLLDFAAAVGKASKIVELEQQMMDPNSNSDTPEDDEEVDEEEEELEVEKKSKFKVLKEKLKGGVKKRATSALVNDRWIAKMVGKITKKLEVARGEAGYSGEIPVALAKYRTGLIEIEGEKLLP